MERDAAVKTDPRRHLPRVDRLVDFLRGVRPELPLWAITEGCRAILAEERERLRGNASNSSSLLGRSADALGAAAGAIAAELARVKPQRVINATGIVLHTNLGRAPLAEGASRAALEASLGYSDLELDLATGQRGNRLGSVATKLELLSGAPAAHAVNNNAAAVLLALNTLALGREVIVSRGELVEIGGSFRVPEIMERAGVRLVEVGTTNRTRIADYERAIGPDTGLLLKVHRSNFEVRGFVEEVPMEELAELGRARGIPVVDDLGSGTLIDLGARGFPADAYAPSRLAAGADLVCFSGDKLLGGPQAGLLIGTSDVVQALRKNPLARALRLDKTSLAALDWTLAAYLDGRAEQEIPVLRELLEPLASLEERARKLAASLASVTGIRLRDAAPGGVAEGASAIEVRADRSFVGGGSLPGFELDSHVVALRADGVSANRLAERLREAPVPVLARIRDSWLLFDVRTLVPSDLADLEVAVSYGVTSTR